METNKYHTEYNRTNYKQIKFWIKPEEYEEIVKLAEKLGVNKTTLFRMAISCLENEVCKMQKERDADK